MSVWSKEASRLPLRSRSAAFDMIRHELLLLALYDRYNIRGSALKWFRSYLSHRKYCVSLTAETFSFHPVDVGVPQSSILSQILFTLFTTPLMNIFEIL